MAGIHLKTCRSSTVNRWNIQSLFFGEPTHANSNWKFEPLQDSQIFSTLSAGKSQRDEKVIQNACILGLSNEHAKLLLEAFDLEVVTKAHFRHQRNFLLL